MPFIMIEKLITNLDFVDEPIDPFPDPEIAPTSKNGDPKTGRFGCGRLNSDGSKRFHGGIDLKAAVNTPIKAIYSGKVVLAKEDHYDYGNYIDILSKHKGITIRYAHLSKISVKLNDAVDAESIVGISGITGNAKDAVYPHLHLEISTDNFAGIANIVDPEPYL